MKRILTAAIAAITLGGAVSATATPASAEHWEGHRGGGHYGRGDGGAAIAAGVVGLALGAALASDHGYSHSYDRGYYNRGYYDGGYGYYGAPAYAYEYPAYRTCETTRWIWDPYIGRRVPVRQAYAC